MRGKVLQLQPADRSQGITPAYAGKSCRGHVQLLAVLGITPAYAGKSGALDEIKGTSEDHPRLCGEKCFIHS